MMTVDEIRSIDCCGACRYSRGHDGVEWCTKHKLQVRSYHACDGFEPHNYNSTPIQVQDIITYTSCLEIYEDYDVAQPTDYVDLAKKMMAERGATAKLSDVAWEIIYRIPRDTYQDGDVEPSIAVMSRATDYLAEIANFVDEHGVHVSTSGGGDIRLEFMKEPKRVTLCVRDSEDTDVYKDYLYWEDATAYGSVSVGNLQERLVWLAA